MEARAKNMQGCNPDDDALNLQCCLLMAQVCHRCATGVPLHHGGAALRPLSKKVSFYRSSLKKYLPCLTHHA